MIVFLLLLRIYLVDGFQFLLCPLGGLWMDTYQSCSLEMYNGNLYEAIKACSALNGSLPVIESDIDMWYIDESIGWYNVRINTSTYPIWLGWSDDKWIYGNATAYIKGKSPAPYKNFADFLALCANTTLPISNKIQNEELYDYARKYMPSAQFIWLYYNTDTGTWLNGQTLTYTHFCTKESGICQPNRKGQPGSCLAMILSGPEAGGWTYLDCSTKLSTLCYNLKMVISD